MMDAVSEPLNSEVTFKTSSQIGKTQIVKNVIGYYMDQDPCPILLVMPNEKMVRSFSKDRLAPMLRDTPSLRGLVKDARAKDSSNEILHKTFRGGHFTGVSAGTASDLVSRPIRVLILEEKDKYKPSAGYSGDPSEMAKSRTKTFHNRKIINVSTPEIEGASQISADFDRSDQRHLFVACPHCKAPQKLVFAQLKWSKPPSETSPPDEVWYECQKCAAKIEEHHRHQMIQEAVWVATHPGRIGHAGFFIWEIYSPWSSFRTICLKFLDAHRSNNPEKLKQFVNEVLGETWRANEELKISADELLNRVEEYVDVPTGAFILTAAADVHADRIEVSVEAWGPGEENWLMDYKVLVGSPEQRTVWTDLDRYLMKSWKHESGAMLSVTSCFVDSGDFADYVLAYTKPRFGRRIFASKGSSVFEAPIVSRPTKNNRARALLYSIGSSTAKTVITYRLKIDHYGPGYQHFNRVADAEYVRQLTSEKLIMEFSKGRSIKKWRKIRNRNEALDIKVLNLAALLLLNPNWPAVMKNFSIRVAKIKPAEGAKETQSGSEALSEAQGPTRPPTFRRRRWRNPLMAGL